MKKLKQHKAEPRWLAPALWVAAFLLPFIFTLLILGLGHPLFLRKVEEMQIFFPTADYFRECMLMPGGVLELAGTYLTQFFYQPWLGAIVFALTLAVMQALIVKACKVPARWAAATGVANAMLTLAPLTLGYVVYTLKSPGFFFTAPLGIATAAAFLWACRCAKPAWLKIVIAAVGAMTYPLFGFYSILASGLIALYALTNKQWLTAAVAVIISAALPWGWFYLTDTIVMRQHIYTSMLPRFLDGEGSLMTPYIIAFTIVAVLALTTGHYKESPKRPLLAAVLSLALMLAAYGSVPLCKYKDPNFDFTLQLDRALQDQQWSDAVEAAEAFEGAPTRLNVLLTDIALLRTGQAGDKMFGFPISDAPYSTTSAREATAMRDAGARLLYYHFGRVNDAYRWCMESKVEFGQKAEYLKYMAKIALLNGEPALAKKYLKALVLTRNYKDWAQRYMAIADDPALLQSDPELAAITPLMSFGNHLGGDGGNMEAYLLQVTNALRGGPPELVELSIISGLIQKDLDEIWPKIVLYSNTHDRLPRHFQEAAIMYSVLKGSDAFRQLKIDPSTEQEFSQFIEMVQANQSLPDARKAELFRPRYGHTYWYYYFFINNLKTT